MRKLRFKILISQERLRIKKEPLGENFISPKSIHSPNFNMIVRALKIRTALENFTNSECATGGHQLKTDAAKKIIALAKLAKEEFRRF